MQCSAASTEFLQRAGEKYVICLTKGLCLYLKERPHSNSHIHVKKRGRHEQDTLNGNHPLKSEPAPKNDTELWKRPRCGVPDLDKSNQQRRKRYALFGGRWDKTDLTYQ